jgi:hypothetical protein
MKETAEIIWVQNPNSSTYNDGGYKVKLPNGKIAGVGDQVLIKFNNGNFRGTIKQTAGFGSGTSLDVISVLLPNKTKGRKININNILDKV